MEEFALLSFSEWKDLAEDEFTDALIDALCE